MTHWATGDLGPNDPWLPDALLHTLAQPDPAPEAVVDGYRQLSATLDALRPFVLPPLLDRYLADPARSRIGGLALTGTILGIDLTEAPLTTVEGAPDASAGGEALDELVTQLFAYLAGTVVAQGGYIVQFAGDTLTAFFDSARLGTDDAARAGATALQIQNSITDFATATGGKGRLRRRLPIAIHSGTLYLFELGDDAHVQVALTGRDLHHLAQARSRARPGEVLISDATLRRLAAAQTEPVRPGWAQLLALRPALEALPPPAPTWEPPPPSPAGVQALLARVRALQPFVPEALSVRLTDVAHEGGEFRPVTALAASFYDLPRLIHLLEWSGAGDDHLRLVGQVLNSYYKQIQSVAAHYGGSISRIEMTPAGNRTLIAFGVPAAHEDDTARAVYTALALPPALEAAATEVAALLAAWPGGQDGGDSGPAPLRAGIAAGQVFAGLVGPAQQHDFVVLGDTVNLAGRLVAAAGPGDVLLTSKVYRAVRHLLQAQPLRPLPVQGGGPPIPVFRVEREREAADARRRLVPLVGRRAELIQLLDLAERALGNAGNPGQVVAVVGEAGVGKSRLVDEMLHELATRIPDAVLLRVICQGHDQMTPYGAITRLLRQVLRVPPGEDAEGQVAAVQQQLDDLVPAWGRFAPLLGPLLGLPFADNPLTESLTPAQQRERLYDLVLLILFALARRAPLVLVIDELQWLDDSSRRLVERLATELGEQRLLLQLIYRQGPEFAEPWRDCTWCSVLSVEALPPADGEALVRALLGGEPPAEVAPLLERAGGTPFFLEETVRYLVESSLLQRDSGGAWTITRPLGAAAIPTGVEQLIMARLDRLDETTRSLAEVASVIGRRFPEALLAAVLPTRFPLAARLAALVDTGLIVPDENADQPIYEFKHVLFRDVAYGSILFARRRTLHARIAEAILQLYPRQLADYEVALAQHYLHAEQWAAAFTHFSAAAQRAQARFAHSEALALYEQAAAVAPWRQGEVTSADTQAVGLHDKLGDVQALLGNYPSARNHYEQALQLLSASRVGNRAVQQAILQRKIGSTYENQGNGVYALSWLNQAIHTITGAVPNEATRLEHARILSDLGWVHWRLGELDQAQRYLEEALAGVNPRRQEDERMRILNRLGGVAWVRGDLQAARGYVEESLASRNLVSKAKALTNLCILSERQGRIDEAVAYGVEALEINDRLGSRREMALSATNVGFALLDREDYAGARDYFTQALDHARAVHDSYHQMLALLDLGRALTALDEWDAAEQATRQSQDLAIRLQLPLVQLETHVVLAELALRRGDPTTAQREYDLGRPLATDQETEEYGRFQRLEARLAVARGDKAHALDLLAANEALFTRLQYVPEVERTRRLRAEIAGAETAPDELPV